MSNRDVRIAKSPPVIAGDGDPLETNHEEPEANTHSVTSGNGETPVATEKKPGRRLKVWLGLGVLAVIGVAVGVPYYRYAHDHVTTDDAFIDGHVIAISPRVSGHVANVYVKDNQWVEKGTLLVALDPQDFDARLAAATAALHAAEAVRDAKKHGVDLTKATSSAGVDEAGSGVEAAKAAIATAQAAVTAAQNQLTEAQAQLPAAKAAFEQAESEVLAAEARHQREQATLGADPATRSATRRLGRKPQRCGSRTTRLLG